ncbi:MAG: hypothetical protein NZ954_01405 [Thermofilaceae archaeon]|nr:hypothetical protein [Thermofilaceae archaeon]MCX8180473.1 hypothetical protein [Thermofilaceae archaeon]MDW8003330.1 hypothetical protein [Thermofilaceae archaeon]
MSFEKLAELKARWLPVYVVLLIVVIVIALHLALMYFMTNESSYANLALLTLFAAYFLLTGIDRLRKMKITRMRFMEVVSCENCGFSEERNHEAGDYVLKTKGSCPKCGTPLIVSAIYSIKEQR